MEAQPKMRLSIDEATLREVSVVDAVARDLHERAPTPGRIDREQSPTPGRIDREQSPTPGRIDREQSPTPGRFV